MVAGIAAIVTAGVLTLKDRQRAGAFDAKIKELTAERADIREQLGATNLEFRGYQKSIPAMPDSTRKQISGEIMEKSRNFNKKIRMFEIRDKELTRLILRQETMKGERRSHLTWWFIGVGGGGILLAGLGLGALRRG
jgi:hypothetical protein